MDAFARHYFRELLAAWLAPLPAELLNASPWLWYWKGAVRLLQNPFEGQKNFERAYALLHARGDVFGRVYAWCGVIDSIFLSYAELARWDPWVLEIEQIFSDQPPIFPADLSAHLACSLFCILAFRQPQNRQLQTWAEAALRQGETAEDRSPVILAHLHWATFHIWRGDLAAAEVVLATLAHSQSKAPLIQVVAHLVEATLAVHSGEHERALGAVTAGLAASEDSGVRLWDRLLLDHAVMTSLRVGDLARADQYLARLSTTVQQMRLAELCYYHFALAWRALLTGQLAVAQRHCEESLTLANRSGVPYFVALTELASALILHEARRPQRAEQHLACAEAIGRELGNDLIRFTGLLWRAYFALDRGDEDSAVEPLREALALGRERGYRYVFHWWPEIMARLYQKAFEHGIEVDWARELVRHHHLPPPSDALPGGSWPWPIKIFTLGRFAVLRDDQPLRFTGKSQRRPLDLLKAVIAFGGREVAERQVAEALWPDAEGDAAQQALATTLFRLRKLLGHEIIQRQAGHLTLDARICWVDCWACERLLGDGSNVGMAGFNKVAALYHAPFLYHEQDAPWSLPMRERLHAKLVRHIAESGKALQQAGRVEEAIAVYLRGLEIDDLCEPFYCELIKAYASLGRACEAASVYHRCQKVLSARLGVEPSLETRRVYLASLGRDDC